MPMSTPEPEIRPMRMSDLPHVVALYSEVFNAPPWNDQWTDAAASRRLSDALHTPGALGLLLWDDDGLVAGLIGHQEHWFDGSSFFLQEMFVHPERQRRGYGSQMMDHLKHVLRTQGVGHIFLTTTREGVAPDFYARHGFRASDRMVLMTCRLEPE